MLTALVSNVPLLLALLSSVCSYVRHSPLTRSRLPNLSTTGCLKLVRNMRMKRIEVKSLMEPMRSASSEFRGIRNLYQCTVSLLPLRSVGATSRTSAR